MPTVHLSPGTQMLPINITSHTKLQSRLSDSDGLQAKSAALCLSVLEWMFVLLFVSLSFFFFLFLQSFSTAMIKAWRGKLQTAEGKRNNRWTLIWKGFGARKNLSIWVKVESAGAEICSDFDSAARACAWEKGGGAREQQTFGLLNDSQMR